MTYTGTSEGLRPQSFTDKTAVNNTAVLHDICRMKFNIFKHIKEDPTDTSEENFDSDNSSEDGGYFVRKFRRSKNKYNTYLSEPIHRKTSKVSKGKMLTS